ncbi:MAG TPA: hypothetical protein VFB63_00830 [Bryobacteraceae bacterium]|jgi:hypothetical protein|nr:hypothetical protein [Bryobacteraceae bacterium]
MSSTDEKLMKLVARLNEKSSNGEVPWEPDAVDDAKFLASFPGYSVAIAKRDRRGGPPVHTFSILDGSGNAIESVSISEDSYLDYWPDANRDLSGLFHLARRKALDVEQALDNLLKAL